MSTVDVRFARADDAAFIGHPKGLFYLAFTEAWERFSYYGMTALLALYMVNQLLLPGHVEHISGFSGFRGALESVLGPLSRQAFASQIFGLYSGFVYFTPLLGGMIADRWIGQRNAVVIGALSMSAGHIAMGFDQSFLLALLLLVIGAIFMLFGLATYLYGYRYLPARVERRKYEGATRLTATERRIVVALIAVMVISIFESIAYGQIFNVSSIWIQQHVALDLGGFRIPVPWFQSINSVFSIASVPLLFWIWQQQALRGREPNELAKIGTGAFLAAASNLIPVAAIFLSGTAPVHPLWPFLYSAGLGISFLYYWPTLLALVSRAAPAKMNATLMGLAFMSLFIANTLVGWIGGFYEKMIPAQFWAMHAAIAIVGGALVVLFGRRLTRLLHPIRLSPEFTS